MSHTLFETHEKTLRGATEAIRKRTYWSPYPEMPSGKIYGESAKADGLVAFEGRLNKSFELDQPGSGRTSKSEVSPYGMKLGIS